MNDVNGISEKNIRLMLVDDNQGLLQSTKILCSRNGIEMICADSIDTAVKSYRKYKNMGKSIDLVITDMTIGEYDTAEKLLVQLRVINPLVRCVLTSGMDRGSIEEICEKNGFISALPKPFRFNQLMDTVNASI